MVGATSTTATLAVSNLPSHRHDILYSNNTSQDGGIWGGGGVDAGNYGGNGGYSGYSGFAYTSFTGSGNAFTINLPVPTSYTVNYFICAK